ncbi:MAG: hypothetical protein K5868_01565 [Lachnospiraceae bacterium]|nr:hypothetical protein [Lachnospiraceae bacterium]
MTKSKRIVLNMFLIPCVGILCACGSEKSIPQEGQEYLQDTTSDQDALPEGDIQGTSEDIVDAETEYATEYYNLVEELYMCGKADSFALVDVNGDEIPELAASESTETYYYDNAYLYTIFDENVKLLISVVTGIDGIHIYYSESNNKVYYTSCFSGSENNVLYRIEEGELKTEKKYDTLYDFENDSYIYMLDENEVSEEDYYESVKADLIPYNSYTSIDYDGLNSLSYYIDRQEYGTFTGIKQEKIETYKNYNEMITYLKELGARIEEEEASSDEDEDYHRIYKRLLEHFMRESSYDDYRYVLDGVGDAVVYDDRRDFEFAFKDINGDGIDEMFIDNHLFIPDEDWYKAYLGPMFCFYDEEDQIIVQTYSMNGYDDISDTYYKLENGELIEVKEVMERYVEDYNPEYYCIYPDGREEQISLGQALAMRPPFLEADYYPLTEEGVREYLED